MHIKVTKNVVNTKRIKVVKTRSSLIKKLLYNFLYLKTLICGTFLLIILKFFPWPVSTTHEVIINSVVINLTGGNMTGCLTV